MSMEILIQYVTYMLAAIGVIAFFVSLITQVIKEMPWFKNIQTNAVAMAVSLLLCPISVVIACLYFEVIIEWYYIFASFLASFIVYLVSTGGWEKVAEMWNRSKYKKNK